MILNDSISSGWLVNLMPWKFPHTFARDGTFTQLFTMKSKKFA